MLIFFKIFNHRWRSLTWLHRCFWAQTNFLWNLYIKPQENTFKTRGTPTTTFGNPNQDIGINQTICLLSKDYWFRNMKWNTVSSSLVVPFQNLHIIAKAEPNNIQTTQTSYLWTTNCGFPQICVPFHWIPEIRGQSGNEVSVPMGAVRRLVCIRDVAIK